MAKPVMRSFLLLTIVVSGCADADQTRWERGLLSQDPEQRLAAVTGIYFLGTRFQHLSLDRTGAYLEENKRDALNQYPALRAKGETAVPLLIRALKDSDRRVRSEAARALGEFALSPQASVAALEEALKDASAEVRGDALRALAKFGEPAEVSIPAFVVALRDGNAEVRGTAAYALSLVGVRDSSTIDPLLRALKDTHDDVRIAAGNALSKRGAMAKPAIAFFISSLGDPNPTIRETSAGYLGVLRLEPALVIPVLRALASQDPEPAVREKAKTALHELERE